jgi:hypothetical protein
MLNKNDCLVLLAKMGTRGIDVDPQMKKLLLAKEIPTDVLKFIAQNQGIEAVNFYEMLRKKHNKQKSPLYTNILKEPQTEEDIITTLVCLLTQIILYGNKLNEAKYSFFEEVRAGEISTVLNNYFLSNDLTRSSDLLKAIKLDLLVLEYLNGRRELSPEE